MAVAMSVLLDDLRAETAVLDALLTPLAPDRWDKPTPAPGWVVRDQVSHLAHFDEVTTRLIATFAATDPSASLPWFGPPMSATSSMTARLMETWAHGQDVADALGVTREPTARLRHVAHLGVAARSFAFANRGLAPPAEPVHVALTAPHGAVWTWGPPDAAATVRGPAEDFCLLVTRRRHRDDLALDAHGDAAKRWLHVAQAFAGPPRRDRVPRGKAP